MMDCNFQPKPIPSPLPLGLVVDPLSKDQIDHHHKRQTQSPSKLTRHRSSGSCYSSQSLLSNATGSSTKTHRRCSFEVGSNLFSPGSEHTTERTDAYTKKNPAPIPLPRLSRQISPGAENHSIHTTSEMRGPDSDRVVSVSCCSRMHVPSVDTLASTDSKSKQCRRDSASTAPEGKHQDDMLRAVELIRELSFDTSVPQITTASYHKKTSCAEIMSSSSTDHSVLPPNKVSDNDDGSARDDPVELVEMEESELPPLDLSSPPLPPKINRLRSCHIADMPSQVVHNRNRTRSTSISEMSESYFNEFVNIEESSSKSSRSYSTCSSNNEESPVIEKKSLITIENDVPSVPILSPRPQVSLLNHGRSSRTIASDQDSFISSASSSSNHFSIESRGQVEDTEEQGHIDLDDPCLTQDHGDLSLQEGQCNTCYHSDLNADNLREWDAVCQEEYFEKGNAKNQFIFRVTSCPNKMNATASPERGRMSMNLQETDNESVEEPHLMAADLSHIISPSLFSYTNSCAASTLSSHKNDLDEITSDLDYNMEFMYSYSIEKSSVSTPLDGVSRLNKSHRRRLSSGSRLGKPLVAPLIAIPKPTLHRENGPLNKTVVPTHRHRRFKSDGSILCKKQTPLYQVVDFSFSEEPSFKSKYSTRHHRGKSLDSFKGEPQIIDCSPLRCILEVLEEASKSSHSADGLPSVVGLVGFLKQNLENLTATRVLELGFLLGLFVGLLIPYVFNAIL